MRRGVTKEGRVIKRPCCECRGGVLGGGARQMAEGHPTREAEQLGGFMNQHPRIISRGVCVPSTSGLPCIRQSGFLLIPKRPSGKGVQHRPLGVGRGAWCGQVPTEDTQSRVGK